MSNANKLNTKATGVIAVAIMCSRVLGLVREVLFNALFGTAWMGVFIAAFRVPNLLRDLFAEGALSTAFITVFSQKIEREGDQGAWALARKMLTLATVFMSLVTLLGIFFADPFISLLAGAFAPEYRAMTVVLTQIMFPFILMVSLAALVMGMLNAKNVFGIPALASSFFNIGSILGGVIFGWLIDRSFGKNALIGLAIGTLVGGFLQFAVQLPSLYKAGFRFRPDFRWNDSGVRRILVLMVPSVIAASAVQVNVLINTAFAAGFGSEALTWLNNAFRLMQLPLGIFGVAVATITLPVVSRIAANADRTEFGPTLGRALRLAVFLTLPSAVGLYLLANPIIGLIYQHGQVKPEDTLQSGYALQFYALGLVAYSCIKVLSPTFYAIDRKWTPMMVSFISIGLNFSLNYFFIYHWHFPHWALALSTSIAAAVNFLILYVLMHREAGTLYTGKLIGTILRCGVASALLGAVCWAGVHYGADSLQTGSLWLRALALFVLVAVAGGAYLVVCLGLGVSEVQLAKDAVLRKLGRLLKRG